LAVISGAKTIGSRVFFSAPVRPFKPSKGRTWLAEVVSLGQGDGVILAVGERPVQGTQGHDRVALRHGASRIKSGERFTL